MAREQLDALLSKLVDVAKEFLSKRDGFIPFAQAMTLDNEIELVAVYTGDEYPDPHNRVEELRDVLRSECARYVAVGICVDTEITDPRTARPTNAILCMLEHRDGEAADVFLPYENRPVTYQKRPLSSYTYGEIFARAGERQVFERDDP